MEETTQMPLMSEISYTKWHPEESNDDSYLKKHTNDICVRNYLHEAVT